MNHLNNQQRSVYQAVIFLRASICNCHLGFDLGSNLGCFRPTYVAENIIGSNEEIVDRNGLLRQAVLF